MEREREIVELRSPQRFGEELGPSPTFSLQTRLRDFARLYWDGMADDELR